MHAFLIVGRNPEAIEEKIDKLIKKLSASPMVFTITKIADIRELTKFTRFTLNKKTAIVIKDFENTTEEAQNAFLKALEEPQKNLFYILAATTLDLVLPTILSRCQVVEISNLKSQISNKEQEEVLIFLDAGIGEKLALIADIKKRERAIDFINKILILGHKKILAGENSVGLITSAKKTLLALKANGNVQLQLTNFVINLDTSPLVSPGWTGYN